MRAAKPAEIDFNALNERALDSLTSILEDLLRLDIKIAGAEVQMLNPHRHDFEHGSFSINSETGEWADFAEDDEAAKGGGVLSLAMYVLRLGAVPAARRIEAFLDDIKSVPDKVSSTTAKPDVPRFPTEVLTSVPQEGAVATRSAPSPCKPGEPSPPLDKAGPAEVARYHYLDEAGQPVAVITRCESASKKTFRPKTLIRRPDGCLAWVGEAPKPPRPLYRLDRLTADPSATVLVCEGEKACEAAEKLFPHIVVTTSMGGAQSSSKTDFSPLAGRNVLIWPDHDQAGSSYASKVKAHIEAHGGTSQVRILKVPMLAAASALNSEAILTETDTREKGWDAADALAEGWSEQHAARWLALPEDVLYVPDLGGDSERAAASEGVPLDETVPEDFLVADGGVYFRQKDRDGNVTPIYLSSRIDVVALAKSHDGSSWGKLVRFADHDGLVREWCIPASMFGQEVGAICSTLSSMGAVIAAQQERRTHLANYLQQCKPTQRALSVAQPGWAGDAFVLPDGSRYGAGPDLICFETRDPNQAKAFVSTGTLDGWKEGVGALCVGNSRLVLAVCIALSAPTLALLGEENGGFHFRGPSSIGKTTSLLVSTSVWGQPARIMKRWRATANGLEGVATTHNDLLLALDEIAEITPVGAAEAAYMLANGQGKARATQHGSSRPTAHWRLAMISTGEVSLANHLSSGGVKVKAGQETRLVDVEADAGAGLGIFETIHSLANGAAMAETLKRGCDAHNGLLGRAFVEVLANPGQRASHVTRLEELIQDFEAAVVPGDASGQVRRVVHRFAVVAAAGELAIEAGLLPWSIGHASWAAKTCLGGWIDIRGGAGELEAAQTIQVLRHHLQTRGDVNYDWFGRRAVENSIDRRTTPRFGFKRLDTNDQVEFLIPPESFSKEIFTGMDARAARKHLADAGFLLAGKTQMTHSLRVGEKPQRFLVIKGSLLDCEDEDSAREPSDERIGDIQVTA